MPTQAELQKEITHRILDALLFGTAPWRKPWRNVHGVVFPDLVRP